MSDVHEKREASRLRLVSYINLGAFKNLPPRLSKFHTNTSFFTTEMKLSIFLVPAFFLGVSIAIVHAVPQTHLVRRHENALVPASAAVPKEEPSWFRSYNALGHTPVEDFMVGSHIDPEKLRQFHVRRAAIDTLRL